jgi:DNA-binding transcriptional LysR family regulator
LRSAACDALDRAGLAWRMAFVSPSLAGFWAAIAAGLGVGVRTPAGLPPSVRQIESATSGLPALPSLKLALYVAASRPTPVTTELGDLIADAVRQSLPQYGLAY